jgi:hypothetical protein
MEDTPYDPETPDNKAWKIDAPTPEEIRERCLEIQATWDEDTRLSRIVDHRIHPDYVHVWEVPVIRIGDLDGDVESVISGIVDTGRDELKHENTWHNYVGGKKRFKREVDRTESI